jgi:nitroreductase
MSLYVHSSAPWTLREADFPIGGTAAERARYLLRYAILAPSTKNTQPWKFAIAGERIEILPDLTRWLRVSDPDRRELHISLGCALENLIVAADHFGYACDVTYAASTAGPLDTVASVTLTPAPAGAPRMRPAGLFEGLTSRQTIHGAFTARGIPPGVQRQIAHLAADPDVRLLLTNDRETTHALAALSAQADVTELGDADYRRELARIVGEGAFGTSRPVAMLARLALPHLDNGVRLARRDDALMRDTPLLGLIATRDDDRTAQIRAGQLFERICLMATILGVHVHPMSQALQIPTLRRQVARLSGDPLAHPQQLFRIGYAAPRSSRRHTPRRPVDRVLVDASARTGSFDKNRGTS